MDACSEANRHKCLVAIKSYKQAACPKVISVQEQAVALQMRLCDLHLCARMFMCWLSSNNQAKASISRRYFQMCIQWYACPMACLHVLCTHCAKNAISNPRRCKIYYLVECTSPRALGAISNCPSAGVAIRAIVPAFQSLSHSV